MSEGRVAADDALRILLKSGDYSDLRIKCGDKEFKVHKAIVCARSEYFAKACKPGAFKVSPGTCSVSENESVSSLLTMSKEGEDGIITLQAATTDDDEDDVSLDDPEAVKLMIDFLYCHDYEAPVVFITVDEANIGVSGQKITPSGDCNTVMHAKMYALGSKYSIPSLQTVALGKFMEAASYAWNTDDFVTTIGLVYTNTPDEDKGLRDIAARTIIKHSSTLLQRPEIESQVRSISGLAYDLLSLHSAEVKKHNAGIPACMECDKEFEVKDCRRHGQYVGCLCYEKKWVPVCPDYGEYPEYICTCHKRRRP
ncbi:hypothetical protein Tdes44962_MAKER00464 [Teratosphaeria destructans]|uniref:BTB domain-containing protein n=1 Tax=Teratosphaeria destructans TaxID=418781 RepID=A0A9W7SPR4_9PEZI|nr:hypothetical protein Tdes44962_MAKER00464 [Teratosphaeria destructans]